MSLLLLFDRSPTGSSLTTGAIFHDACSTSANYNGVYGTATLGGNNGMFGSLGASGSLHMTLSSAAYSQQGAWKQLSSAATVYQFYVRPSSTMTLGANGVSLFTVYPDSTLTNSASPARVDMLTNGTGYNLAIVDSSNSYTTTVGSTLLSLGKPVRVVLYQTSAGWYLYLNNNTTPEVTYTRAQSVVGYQNIFIGSNSENGPTPTSGIIDFDEIWCGNMLSTAPTTVSGKIADAYQGYLMNHLSADGQPYRGPVDGNNLSSVASIDTVSETASYLLTLAVQNNDQASFKLCDNWVLANLLRSVSTTVNTQNNAAPTNALNLMSFHYNSANTDGKGIGTIYDANWASDADVQRAQSLLWAHSRWGSSAYAVGSANELTTPNYQQRALNVIADLKNYAFANSTGTGYNYLVNDSFQTGATVQIAPDYNDPAAYHLFAQYDTGNSSFWTAAINGAYDIVQKAATVIFSGAPDSQSSTANLNPNWLAMTVSTATVSTTRSTYGDPNYGYNAFRIYSRLYNSYQWYGDGGALTSIREPKTFFTNQWTTNSKIFATYNHDGTNPATYENSMFTYAAYFTIYTNDTSNTTASAIMSNKLSNLYYQEPYGSIISSSPTSAGYSYFDQSWDLVNYMQLNGLYINYGQSTSSTITKNQNAIARIAVNRTLTQSSIARIANNRTNAQTAISRIANNPTKTQTSVARIANNPTKTQTSVSRISNILTRTQSSKARVANNLTKTQSATANITTASTLTKTQSATARIAVNRTSTQGATARIARNLTKTQTSIARIANNFTRTQGSIARIANNPTKTQSATARIQRQLTKTQSAVGRIAVSLTKTQGSVASIANTRTIAQTAKARIATVPIRTQTSTARIQRQLTKTQTGTARIVQGFIKTQSATARIANNRSSTQLTIARISNARTLTQSSKSRIAVIGTSTQSATAKVVQASSKSFSQSATARIIQTVHFELDMPPIVIPNAISLVIQQVSSSLNLTVPSSIQLTLPILNTTTSTFTQSPPISLTISIPSPINLQLQQPTTNLTITLPNYLQAP